MSTQLFETVLKMVKPGYRVLDLGAGDGKHARMFNNAGAQVVAVDRRIPEVRDMSIRWHEDDVIEFVLSQKSEMNYDLIFLNNIMQFLPKEEVFINFIPKLKTMVVPGGALAIRTFFKTPEPPFMQKNTTSFYFVSELEKLFTDWSIELSNESDFDGPDMKGIMRHFFISDIIVRRGGIGTLT